MMSTFCSHETRGALDRKLSKKVNLGCNGCLHHFSRSCVLQQMFLLCGLHISTWILNSLDGKSKESYQSKGKGSFTSKETSGSSVSIHDR